MGAGRWRPKFGEKQKGENGDGCGRTENQGMEFQDIGQYIENADDDGSSREKKGHGKWCRLIARSAWFDKQREPGQSDPLQLSAAGSRSQDARCKAKFYGENGADEAQGLGIHKEGDVYQRGLGLERKRRSLCARP